MDAFKQSLGKQATPVPVAVVDAIAEFVKPKLSGPETTPDQRVAAGATVKLPSPFSTVK